MLTTSTAYSLHAKIMPRQLMARSYGEGTRTTYIALLSLTDAGIKAAMDSLRLLDAAKKLLTWAAR
jgi:hypothetical protein